MRGYVLAVVGVMMLVGCNAPAPEDKNASDASNAQDAMYQTIGGGKMAIKAQMKDPESTQFMDDFATKQGGYCGMVNAKNGFGGYGEPVRFAAMGPIALTEESVKSKSDRKAFDDFYKMACEGEK